MHYDVFNLSPDHVMKSHVIGRLNSIYRSLKIWFTYSFFFETLVDNIKNWYYKVRQLLQNVIRKQLSKIYYKVWQRFITNCVRYYKCGRPLLQSGSGITECDSYYKVRLNTRYNQNRSLFLRKLELVFIIVYLIRKFPN